MKLAQLSDGIIEMVIAVGDTVVELTPYCIFLGRIGQLMNGS